MQTLLSWVGLLHCISLCFPTLVNWAGPWRNSGTATTFASRLDQSQPQQPMSVAFFLILLKNQRPLHTDNTLSPKLNTQNASEEEVRTFYNHVSLRLQVSISQVKREGGWGIVLRELHCMRITRAPPSGGCKGEWRVSGQQAALLFFWQIIQKMDNSQKHNWVCNPCVI